MDIQLPDIDGIEALARLRADERTASIPVVALTAQAMHGDRERFLAAGFDGYLSKPVDIVELVGAVRQHCDGGGTMSDNGKPTILVVDDVPENVRLLEAVLTPRGYHVVSATRRQRRARARHVGEPGPRPARRRDAGAWTATRSAVSCASTRRRRCCR